MSHAGHRLVEQHHFRIERQRRRDFERALAPVRHLDRGRLRKLAQADIVEQFMGAAVETVEHRFGTPEIEGVSVLTLQRDPDVLQRRQMRKHRRNLERAHQPETRHIGRRQRGDILALVQDLPGRRPQELGQEIEARRLAGPVRPDQRMNTATANPQIDTANGKEPREFLGQSVGFENELIGQSNFPPSALAPDLPSCVANPC